MTNKDELPISEHVIKGIILNPAFMEASVRAYNPDVSDALLETLDPERIHVRPDTDGSALIQTVGEGITASSITVRHFGALVKKAGVPGLIVAGTNNGIRLKAETPDALCRGLAQVNFYPAADIV